MPLEDASQPLCNLLFEKQSCAGQRSVLLNLSIFVGLKGQDSQEQIKQRVRQFKNKSGAEIMRSKSQGYSLTTGQEQVE